MKVQVPYETKGQQLGETRQAMTKDLMQKTLEKIMRDYKHLKGKYYVLFHAKKYPNSETMIYIKPIVLTQMPPAMLGTLVFGVDNSTGVLTIERVLPLDRPIDEINAPSTPVKEVVDSVKDSNIIYHYDDAIMK